MDSDYHKRYVKQWVLAWKFLGAAVNGEFLLVMRYQESEAGSVFQAAGILEFEDDLRTGVLPGDWC